MADPFVAEIRIFPFWFAPRGWATCDGQLLPISQNTALFSLLGTTYGGDGKSTFALPDLNGRVPVHDSGQNDEFFYGSMGGSETVTLLTSEMPLHTHQAMASNQDGTFNAPANNRVTAVSPVSGVYQATPAGLTSMDFNSVAPSGGSLPHNNMQPYLALTFCIAMQGVFPPRG